MNKAIRNLIVGLVIFVIGVGVLGTLVYLEIDDQATIQAEIDKIEPQIKKYEDRKKQRDEVLKAKEEMESRFTNFVAYLPSRDTAAGKNNELPAMIEGFLKSSNCTVSRISYKEGQKDPLGNQYKDFSRTVISLTGLRGNFNQVRDLVAEIEKFRQLLRVDKFMLTPTSEKIGDATGLTGSMDISLFYYDKSDKSDKK